MINDTITIKNNVIFINDEILPYEIADTIEIDDKILVRIEVDIGSNYNRNVFCFSKNGVLEWQIQESSHADIEDNPFVAMNLLASGELLVSIWSGINYIVNLSNGFIKPYSFSK